MHLLLIAMLSAAAAASPDLATRREGARAILKTHCGACHDPARATALRKAMQIYDLAEPDFASRMTPAQLEKLAEQLEQRQFMSKAELRAATPRGAPAPLAPTEKEVTDLKVYVTLELINRAH